MTRRTLFALPILIGLLTLWGGGVSQWSRPSATAEAEPVSLGEPLPVATMQAELAESYRRQRQYTGLLREVRRSQLSFQRGGEILELLVDEGARIEEGQILGRLDDRHIRAHHAQLKARLAEADAVLAELVAGPRPQTIAAKRAELRAEESQQQVLAKQLARRRKLVQTTSVSREEYERFLFDYQAAEARVEEIQSQLDELLAGTRSEQIAAQRARLAQLGAQLTDIAHDLEDTELAAPFAGRIARRLIDEGAVVNSGSAVLEVIDDTHLEAWVGLPPQAAESLRIGDHHQLTVDGTTVDAVVQSLAPDVNRATRTRNAIFQLNPSAARVLPGQVVRLTVEEQVTQPGYWIPTTALTRGTRGLWSVFVVQSESGPSVVARRDVELLDTVGPKSFVRGSLQPGEQIVVSGGHRVVVGQLVSPHGTTLARKAR